MQSRIQPILRIVTVVLVIGIVAVAGLIVAAVLDTDKTPTNIVEKAVFEAEEAVRANPENADARIKLSAAYTQNGAFAAATEQATIAIRLDPTNPAAHYALGLAQSKSGDTKAAITTLNKAATLEGQLAGFYADVWAALAKAYERDEQIDKAIEAMNEALNFGPENSEMLFQRGSLYERTEQWVDALYDYYQATAYVSDHEEALAGIERISESHPEAIPEVRERFGVGEDGSLDATAPAPAE